MIQEILKRMRVTRGWTSTKAAEELNITPQYLSRIENGRQKPSETLLQTMIEKYEVAAEDAMLLLKNAGYLQGEDQLYSQVGSQMPQSQPEQASTIEVLPAKDLNPIFYTNVLFVSSDDFGIVIDAGQRVGPTNKIQIITRIGFSLEHATKIHEVLGAHIDKLKKGIKN